MAYLFTDPRTASAALGMVIACAQSLQKAIDTTEKYTPPTKHFLSYCSGFVTLSRRWISLLEQTCPKDPKQGDLV
jgi:hypothetical protein